LKKITLLAISCTAYFCCIAQLQPGNYIITLADGGKALDADAPGMNSNDGKVHLWDNNDGVTQVWRVSSAGGTNVFIITLAATGKILDADGPGMYTDGGKVHLWEFNGGKTQRWKISSTGDNSYNIVLLDGGKALDAGISSMYQNDGLVHLWSYNNGKTQKWMFTPAAPPHTTSTGDAANAPMAIQADIDEFNNVMNDQNGVGVLGGDNTRPFYYHANQPNESVYKYQKLIDASRLPSSFLDWAKGKLKDKVPLIGGTLSTVVGIAQDAVDYVESWFSSSATNTWIDCWYPVSPNKITVCGLTEGDDHICSQDYLHTKLTIDKDVNIDIIPGKNFRSVLSNRWLSSGEQDTLSIEAEVRPKDFSDQSTIPKNPLLLEIKKNTNVCVYGPWMADILDIAAVVPIPFTDDKIDIGKLDINTNNEIHPVNQIWYKKGANETDLIAIADGNGYFEKTGNGEIEASGINRTMRFYIGFYIPARIISTVVNPVNPVQEYYINGVGYDFTNSQPQDVQTDSLILTLNNAIRLKVHDNSFVKTQKTHTVFFDKIRKRADGSIQGYIVVETVPLVERGGTINIIVNKTGDNVKTINRTMEPVRMLKNK
jgi:hypothetical protein